MLRLQGADRVVKATGWAEEFAHGKPLRLLDEKKGSTMMPGNYVYLSGPVLGLSFIEGIEWRALVSHALPPYIRSISPMRNRRYHDHSERVSKEDQHVLPSSTDRAHNSRSRFDVLRSTSMLVNLLGTAEISVETVMEIALAYDHNIPVVVVIEPEGNPHDHPMIRDCTAIRVASLEEAVEAIVAIVSPEEKHIWTRWDQVSMLRDEKRLDLHNIPLRENLY